jgi:subtilisin family serine protease
MTSAVFQEKSSHALLDSFSQELERYSLPVTAEEFAPAAATAAAGAPEAGAALSSKVGEEDFRVVSQRFEDGPAVVEMTDAARLALSASNPSLRVLPITRYYLPGHRPTRRKSGQPASGTAAESAIDANGKVYSDDLKQYLLGSMAGLGDGTGVTVGVLDTGVDSTHPALQQSILLLRCLIPGVDSNAGGPVSWPEQPDRAGHGTHVAGIIAARSGHGGPAGVASQARIVSYRIFPDSPKGVKATENPVIIDSIRAAIDDGCHIINLSIEGAPREDGVRSAIAEAWENGVVCIAAAGNQYGNPVSYPGSDAHCVAVTAIGREGNFPDTPAFRKNVSNQRSTSDPKIFLADFSNFGPQVKFTAPGHAIVSTYPGSQWWFSSGTSMSAPYISGLLAALLSGNNNVLQMQGNAARSAATLQMLVGRAHLLGLPQVVQEGFGLPG